MTSVFQVECEWDIGQEYVLFSTYEKAEEWCSEKIDQYLPEYNIIDLFAEYLLNIKEIKVI